MGLAIGGHGFVRVAKGARGDGLFGGADLPEMWRCLRCHHLVPRHLLDEGFYPRPCASRRELEA